jgi:hypothetical protein
LYSTPRISTTFRLHEYRPPYRLQEYRPPSRLLEHLRTPDARRLAGPQCAEHDEDDRGRHKTYHRRFRFPKTIDDEDIWAEYTNGILEVRLPIEMGAAVTGREIEVQG